MEGTGAVRGEALGGLLTAFWRPGYARRARPKNVGDYTRESFSGGG